MARERRTRLTTYGAAHRTARDQATAAFTPGQPCAIGGEPLWSQPAWLDLAHTIDHTGYLGLACRHHNRAEGARRGNRLRARQQRPIAAIPARWRPSRNW